MVNLAHRTSCCQATFCQQCIRSQLDVFGQCICLTQVTQVKVSADDALDISIFSSQVKCPEDKCGWQSNLARGGINLISHMRRHPLNATVLNPSISPRGNYNRYDNRVKPLFVKLTHELGSAVRAATSSRAPSMFVPPSTIQSWVSGVGNNMMPGFQRKPHIRPNGRKFSESQELRFAHTLKDQIQKGVEISPKMLKSQAMSYFGTQNNFRASPDWCNRMSDANSLQFRTPTPRQQLSKKNPLSDGLNLFEEKVALTRKYWSMIFALQRAHPELQEPSNVVNCDEMRFYLESHAKRCLSEKGAKRAEVLSRGHE